MQVKISIVQNIGKKTVIESASKSVSEILRSAGVSYDGNTVNMNGYVLDNSELNMSLEDLCSSKGISRENIVISSIHKYHNA